MSQKIYKSGYITFGGLVGLLGLLTFIAGVNYSQLISSMIAFIGGGLVQVPDGHLESIWQVMSHTTALCLLIMGVSLITGITTTKLIGTSKSYGMESLDKILDYGCLPFFLVIVAEEIFARWIPLGLFTKMFQGETAFYVLLFLGNIAWAVIHLFNYEDQGERSVLRILPQFVAGFGFAYIFVRYGFIVTVMAHYLYDVVLVSSRKERPFTGHDVSITGFYIILVVVSGFILLSQGFSLATLSPWVSNVESLSPLPSIGFWGYVWLLVFVDSLFEVLARLLLFDGAIATKDLANPLTQMFYYVMIIIIIWVINWIAGFFVQDPVSRTFATVLSLSLMSMTTSGSMLARIWFTQTPVYFLITAILVALGFWYAVALILVVGVINYFPTLLKVRQSEMLAYTLQQ